MNSDRWRQIDRLLDEALDLPTEERALFLERACGGDLELRREVESLLEAHAKSETFIETPAIAEENELISDSTESYLGRQLGTYEVISLLGAGGMGEVYRARDKKLDRQVAIKVLPPHLASQSEWMLRFEREANAVAALSHPNILSIYALGQESGATYAVMELLEGETLRERIKRKALPWREAIRVGSAVADGLAAAHARGIIHRDIKPENIFLTADGQIKILDFGLARMKQILTSQAETLASAEYLQTRPGTLMGTIGYMSPEQVRGEEVDAPGDIFSLGCVLMEMLTGQRPFQRDTAAETMAAILRDESPPLKVEEQDLPEELVRIVKRCLEKAPADRYQSARDLMLDLRSLLTQPLTAGRPAATPAPRPRLRMKRRLWPVMAMALLLALGALGFWWWKSRLVTAPLNSLAVLPLANADNEPEMAFLSEGIAESIIRHLSPLRPKLRVLAHSAVIRYRSGEVDPKKLGRELNVRVMLVGSVRRQGDNLVVSVELVDTADNTQLWSEQYQRRRADLQAVQEEISRRISEKLRLNLTGEEERSLATRETENSDAYYAYLNGRYFWNQRSNEGLYKAITYYERAITLDPGYGLAYAGMADAYALLDETGPAQREARVKAEALAKKAIELNSHLAEPYATQGFLRMFQSWAWEEAEACFRRSLEADPGYATAHHWYALLLAIEGRFDQALEEIKRAREVDPRSFPINKDQGEILFYARRYPEAIAQLRAAIEADPANDNVPTAHYWIRNCYEQLGDLDAAIQELTHTATPPDQIAEFREALSRGPTAYWQKRLEIGARRAKPDQPDGRIRLVYLHAASGNLERAISLLEQSVRQDHHDGVMYLKVDPRFDPLRHQERFAALLQEMNLERN